MFVLNFKSMAVAHKTVTIKVDCITIELITYKAFLRKITSSDNSSGGDNISTSNKMENVQVPIGSHLKIQTKIISSYE